jgi:hypothetical protein
MFDNIQIEWEDNDLNEKNDLFDSLEVDRYQRENSNLSLNFDVLVQIKKTSLNKIIDFILDELEKKIDKKILSSICNFIAYSVVVCLNPKALVSCNVFKDNSFREIENLFEEKYGDKYISKSKIEQLPNNLLDIVNYLIRNKILKEDKDCYWVHKVILKNIKIDF